MMDITLAVFSFHFALPQNKKGYKIDHSGASAEKHIAQHIIRVKSQDQIFHFFHCPLYPLFLFISGD